MTETKTQGSNYTLDHEQERTMWHPTIATRLSDAFTYTFGRHLPSRNLREKKLIEVITY